MTTTCHHCGCVVQHTPCQQGEQGEQGFTASNSVSLSRIQLTPSVTCPSRRRCRLRAQLQHKNPKRRWVHQWKVLSQPNVGAWLPSEEGRWSSVLLVNPFHRKHAVWELAGVSTDKAPCLATSKWWDPVSSLQQHAPVMTLGTFINAQQVSSTPISPHARMNLPTRMVSRFLNARLNIRMWTSIIQHPINLCAPPQQWTHGTRTCAVKLLTHGKGRRTSNVWLYVNSSTFLKPEVVAETLRRLGVCTQQILHVVAARSWVLRRVLQLCPPTLAAGMWKLWEANLEQTWNWFLEHHKEIMLKFIHHHHQRPHVQKVQKVQRSRQSVTCDVPKTPPKRKRTPSPINTTSPVIPSPVRTLRVRALPTSYMKQAPVRTVIWPASTTSFINMQSLERIHHLRDDNHRRPSKRRRTYT